SGWGRGGAGLFVGRGRGVILVELVLRGQRAELALSRAKLRLASQSIERLKRLDLAVRAHAELGELASAWQHLSLQRPDGAIERINCAAQVAAETAQVAGEHGQAAVEVFAERANGRGVLGKRKLAPAVGDR